MIQDNEIKTVVQGLFNSFEAVAKKNYEQVKELLKVDTSDPESFFFSFTYPLNEVIEVLIKQDSVHGDKLAFLYQNYSYVEGNFNRIIERIEGSVCCSDKSRTIVDRLADYFKTGKEISFNYDQEYTYHFPTTILKTHDDILAYFDSLMDLYYGRAEKYLEQQLKLIQSISEETASEN